MERLRYRGMDDSGLIAAAQDGDDDAVVEIHERYRRLVMAAARSVTNSREDAEDLAQFAFTQLIASVRRRIPGTPIESTSAWLVKVVRNAARDSARRRGRQQVWDTERVMAERDEEHAAGRGARQGNVELRGKLLLASAGLTDDQRRAIFLRHFLDMSHAQIAELTESTPGAVQQLCHRAYKQIDAHLRANRYPVEDIVSPSRRRWTRRRIKPLPVLGARRFALR